MSIYLDYNSSAPIDSRVLEYMIDIYQNIIGNADSRTHEYGINARKVVELARKQAASILGINSDEVFFTGGATESNNIALQGLKQYSKRTGKKHIITTSIEHKSILETAKHLADEGFEVDFIDPNSSGSVSLHQVIQNIREDTLLVSVMHVNNETGIIQPVNEIGDYLAEKDALFHVDATQSFGKLVEELRSVKYNMLSMSAHKIGGPQGVGLLVLRKKGYRLPPIQGIMYGGQQEHGIRPGTIPVALVAGLGKACELAEHEYRTNYEKCKTLKQELISIINKSGLKYVINGDQDKCIANTINLCFQGVSSEALMLAVKDYCGISNGSACNSNSYNPSYVLTAMGIEPERIENSIRISWGSVVPINLFKESISRIIMTAKSLVF